jgi:predicted transcriptional regulator
MLTVYTDDMTKVDPIVKRLDKARKDRGLNVNQLSVMSGVPRSNMYRAFRGDYAMTTVTAVKLAHAMGLKRIDI